MTINTIDNISFKLNKQHDFNWLKKYGKAFWRLDETGSGCICVGMEKAGKKYFCKIAGVDTVTAEVSPRESVETLKKAVRIYEDLEHPNLIKLVEAYEQEELYIAVFQWAEGECLFDHWNFEAYEKDASLKSPKEKVKELSIRKSWRW